MDTARSVKALETSLAITDNHIATLEQALTAANTIIVEIKAASGTAVLASISASASTASSSVSNLASELRKRADRGKNVIITDIENSGNDDVIVRNILITELQIVSTVTSISRLGKGKANQPAPMLIVFQCPEHASAVIKCAKNFRLSADQHVKTSHYISPDYTKLERQE